VKEGGLASKSKSCQIKMTTSGKWDDKSRKKSIHEGKKKGVGKKGGGGEPVLRLRKIEQKGEGRRSRANSKEFVEDAYSRGGWMLF